MKQEKREAIEKILTHKTPSKTEKKRKKKHPQHLDGT
jgi:hypothetical protein